MRSPADQQLFHFTRVEAAGDEAMNVFAVRDALRHSDAGGREAIGSHCRADKGGYSVKIIKAIYNFIVGDMVILIGVALAVTVLALINNVSALAPLKDFSGPFLVIAVLSSLVVTKTVRGDEAKADPICKEPARSSRDSTRLEAPVSF
jgi:hypothetical protein